METIKHRRLVPGELPLFDLREGDRRAMEAYSFSQAHATQLSLDLSVSAFAVSVDGEDVALWGFGAQGLVASCAYGWLITAPLCNAHRVAFARQSRDIVDNYILDLFPAVEVLVQPSHTQSRRWLRWLGFREIATSAVNGHEFLTLRKER